MSVGVFAQEISISGTIVDSSYGDPVIGVTVIEKGTTNDVVADIDGAWSLKVKKEIENKVLELAGYLRD